MGDTPGIPRSVTRGGAAYAERGAGESVLLIHGDDDRNVAFSQSLLLARELTARRVPFEQLAFPNERHSFFTHDHWLKSYRATEAFLNKYLQDKRK